VRTLYCLLHGYHKYLAIADVAGFGSVDDRAQCPAAVGVLSSMLWSLRNW